MKKILLFCFVAILTQEGIAQCTTAPNGQFPLSNFIPNCVGAPIAIDPFCTTTNYSLVSILSGNYQFSSSIPSDYITITNSAGNVVLAHGPSPVLYASGGSADVRFYTHSNAACGNDAATRTRFIQCGMPPTTVPDCALIMTPISGTVDLPISPAPLLSWFPISINAQAYKVYLGTSIANAVLIANVTQTQTTLTDLLPSTTYYVYVVPYNIIGDAVGCENIFFSSFTTAAVPTLNCANAVNISDCGNAQVANFSASTGTYNPVNNNCGFNTPGQELLYSFTAATSGNYNLNVTAASGGFVNYFFKDATSGDCSNFGWSCIGSVGASGILPLGFLNGGTTYYILLDKELATAGSQTFNIVCPSAAPANNEATGAIPVTVNAGCTGAPFTNVNAFQSINEPIPDCAIGGFSTVWYSFVSPASGAVRVSTDLGSGNSNFDTRIALYEASNPADYGTFNLISCDEDGGSVIGFGLMSVLYATGLTPGNTYYVQVGNNDNSGEGTFCLAVDELNSSMLAAANTCASGFQTPFGSNINYTGWVPLLDVNSKLIALVKSSAGSAVENYTIAQNIHVGAVRFSADLGTHYLNRSFRITNPTVSNAEVQLFYLNSELTALQGQVPAATISTLGVAKQSETVSGCHPNLSAANGPISELNQDGSGSVNNVSWLSFTTAGFSNFYLKNIDGIVPISILNFQASKQTTSRNYIYWKLNCVGSEDNDIVLERSTDQQYFEPIHTFQSLNALECSQAFSYVDNHPSTAVNFYRLRIVDADQRVKYSQILSVNNSARALSLISLAPNPATQFTNLNFVSELAKPIEVRISNSIGAQLSTQQFNVVQGQNQIPINCTKLSSGIYYLTVVDAEGLKQTMKFIKQ